MAYVGRCVGMVVVGRFVGVAVFARLEALGACTPHVCDQDFHMQELTASHSSSVCRLQQLTYVGSFVGLAVVGWFVGVVVSTYIWIMSEI